MTAGNSAYPEDKNTMSDMGEKYGGKVHCVSSSPGKFNFGFMGADENGDKPTPKSTQPAGTYPIGSGSEGQFAKPVHAPGTLIPTETVKGGGK